MEHFDIIPATLQDLETILRLQKECYLEEAELYETYTIPPLTQDLESLKNDFGKTLLLKVLAGEKIVGSIRGYSENGTCYVGRLMVHKTFQNKGIGQLLMHSLETAFKKNCERFELFTGYKSHKNLHVYEKLGYKEFKREQVSEAITLVYMEKISTKPV